MTMSVAAGETNINYQCVRVAALGAEHHEGSAATGAGQPQPPNAAAVPVVASCVPAAAAADMPADEGPMLVLPQRAPAVPEPPDAMV